MKIAVHPSAIFPIEEASSQLPLADHAADQPWVGQGRAHGADKPCAAVLCGATFTRAGDLTEMES